MSGKAGTKGTVRPPAVRPKKSCCNDRPRCKRCPIRLLAEGRLSPDDARAIFARDRNRRLLAAAPDGGVKRGKNRHGPAEKGEHGPAGKKSKHRPAGKKGAGKKSKAR